MNKILVITGPGIGDAVLSVPLFVTIKRNLPKCKLHAVNWTAVGKKGDSLGKEIFDRSCKIDKIMSVDVKSSWLNKIVCLFKLMKERYDLVIDCYPGTNNTALFSYFIGKKKAGFDFNKTNSNLYDTKIKPNKENKVILENNLLKKLGFNIKNPKLVNLAKKKIKTNAIGVSFARDHEFLRAWPDERWAELLDRTKKQIIFIGTDSNKGRISNIQRLMKNKKTKILLNKSLDDVANLISGLNMFITENNGIMHLASTTNVPLIALSGPSFYGWSPYGNKTKEIRGEYPCGFPCDTIFCKIKTNDCMKTIGVEQVWKEVKKKIFS